MGNDAATHVQEAQRIPYRINPRRNAETYINQSNQKKKLNANKNSNSSKEKATNNKHGRPHKVINGFFSRKFEGRRKC